MGKRRGSVEEKAGSKQPRKRPAKQRRGSQARAAETAECKTEEEEMGKQRGSADAKTGTKKSKNLPAKRRRGSQAKAAEQGDGKDDMHEDGKAPTKKSKPTAPGVRNTKKTVKSCVAETSPAVCPRKKPTKPKKPTELKKEETEEEIRDLLNLERIIPEATVKKGSDSEDPEEESEDEWEDVEELNGPAVEDLQATTSLETDLPAEPVEIEIETAEAARKRLRREKRKAEFAAYLRRMMNRFSKELREDTHKVHLLCLLGNGFHRSNTCNMPDLLAVALSVVPAKFTSPASLNLTYLTNLLNWFTGTFTLNPEMSVDDKEPLSGTLERRFGVYGIRDEEEMVHIFLIILRALKLVSRLVLSLQPVPFKEPPAKTKCTSDKSAKVSKKARSTQKSPKGKLKTNPKKKNEKKIKQEATLSGDSDEGENEKPADITPVSRRALKSENKSNLKVDNEKETKPGPRPKNQLRRSAASKVTYKEDSESGAGSSDSDFSFSDSESDYSDFVDTSFEKKVRRVSAMVKAKSTKGEDSNPMSPSNTEKSTSKSSPKHTNNTNPKRRGKIISTDEEEEEQTTASNLGSDQWVEVYFENDGTWVCVDCVNKTLGKPQLCYKSATKPVTYVVAIDNDGCVKDVTRRYDAQWMTSTRKRRIDEEWWEETLMPYKNPNSEREEKEDAEFEAKLLEQPLPTSITEYKNHPLYVLKRHLLKYEAIYPETAAILGYCRGEAVYARSCVHTLHSRDTWLKEARVVRLGEVPYKMVKGQSNRARKARLADPEKKDSPDLALYGPWQTEDYQPPVAVGGKVPRNEFGNVYLFKPSMLPIGCTHLQVPNLNRVARKLDIDCVPAITGFDFHCGFSHPVTDGYIVCEEHTDVLLAAWDSDQAEMERKQKEKREKRALGNWKLLIKGLLIRERLKARYGNKDIEQSSSNAVDKGFSSDEENQAETVAQDIAVSWPQNRQTEDTGGGGKVKQKSKREKKGETKHLFPFEKM
ncbi:DNA repair complementing XP-C cells [Pelobates cultripes]|uniref:DNA repair complementing XP-C cells n=1 Tax=Pelobates cultripes TaxID=61616 RepID=A0AAD1WL07_PELCU|nr:DNA repair complementing XP-C cells [Pelobates cultripes]